MFVSDPSRYIILQFDEFFYYFFFQINGKFEPKRSNMARKRQRFCGISNPLIGTIIGLQECRTGQYSRILFFSRENRIFFLYFLCFHEKKRKDMLAWAIFPFLCVFFFKVTLGSKSDFVEYYLNVFVTFIAIWLCQKLYLEKMPENISMEIFLPYLVICTKALFWTLYLKCI